MVSCLQCGKETNNPKFCSRSCSVTYNNTVSPKRKKILHPCHVCGQLCSRSRLYCCSACRAEARARNSYLSPRTSRVRPSKESLIGVVILSKYVDTKSGYVKLYLDSGAIVEEHRYVVVNYLGTDLPYNTVIHHIDGDVTNNSLDNLSLFSRSDHARFHKIGGVPPVSVLRRHQLLDELFQESVELGLAY